MFQVILSSNGLKRLAWISLNKRSFSNCRLVGTRGSDLRHAQSPRKTLDPPGIASPPLQESLRATLGRRKLDVVLNHDLRRQLHPHVIEEPDFLLADFAALFHMIS